MFNIFLIVLRESLEAALIVGILMAWCARQSNAGVQRRALWLGVAGGVALAGALALALYHAQSHLAGQALEALQIAIMLLAAALIAQMVIWMHHHGRFMKSTLEARAEAAGAGRFALALIAALAVAREGAETVIFLAGQISALSGQSGWALFAAALAGLLAALLLAWLVTRGARFLNLRWFFGVTKILLLLIAHGLLIHGIEQSIGADWLPPLLDPAWDVSNLFDESAHAFTRGLADFTGVRSRPSGSALLGSVAFWLAVALGLKLWRPQRREH